MRPIVHRGWDGEPILLPGDPTQVLDPAEMPGSPTGSATTSSRATGRPCSAPTTRPASRSSSPPPTGSLRDDAPARDGFAIAFTVDEEVGRGTDHFDLDAFGADFAYTFDGSGLGELETETFSAYQLVLTIDGVGVHPGSAKGRLVNASS